MTPQEHLNAAADYIEEHGWCQTVLRDGERVCVIGAIRAVHKGRSLEPRDPVYGLLRERIGPDNIVAWNDDPGRTVEDVLAALRGAA